MKRTTPFRANRLEIVKKKNTNIIYNMSTEKQMRQMKRDIFHLMFLILIL